MTTLSPILHIPPHQRLQTRLTLQFIVANVIGTAVIVGVLILVVGFIVLFSSAYPQMLQDDMQKLSPEIASFLEPPLHDTAGLEAWLLKQRTIVQKPSNDDSGLMFEFGVQATPRQFIEATITDARGVILASSPPESFVSGQLLQNQLPTQQQNLLLNAQRGETRSERLSIRISESTIVAVAPIFSRTGKVLGMGFVRVTTPFSLIGFLTGLALAVLPSAGLALICSGIIGSLFGYFSSRALTRRISKMAVASQQWGEGNFTAQVPLEGNDELTELSLRLNQTAQELSRLVELRQDIATLEERNRLARDLHDTVKQQIFALVMQLGAVRVLIHSQPEVAAQRLTEAESLARQSQQELMSLIQELRPSYQDNRSVAVHLQELVYSWERRTGVTVQLTISDCLHSRRFSGSVELSLLRIAQEALSNIARHSGATDVAITLTVQELDSLLLVITDNGLGFDRRLRQSANGLGMSSMRERALSLPQGTFDIITAPGSGTEIRVRCNIGENEELNNV